MRMTVVPAECHHVTRPPRWLRLARAGMVVAVMLAALATVSMVTSLVVRAQRAEARHGHR